MWCVYSWCVLFCFKLCGRYILHERLFKIWWESYIVPLILDIIIASVCESTGVVRFALLDKFLLQRAPELNRDIFLLKMLSEKRCKNRGHLKEKSKNKGLIWNPYVFYQLNSSKNGLEGTHRDLIKRGSWLLFS